VLRRFDRICPLLEIPAVSKSGFLKKCSVGGFDIKPTIRRFYFPTTLSKQDIVSYRVYEWGQLNADIPITHRKLTTMCFHTKMASNTSMSLLNRVQVPLHNHSSKRVTSCLKKQGRVFMKHYRMPSSNTDL